jgi:hypothetical protein
MTDTTTTSRHSRESKPETIDLGDDVADRNDILAEKEGVSVRTLNRGDAKGDPYLFHGGVKYRPRKGHQDHLRSKIQVRGQAPKRGHR